MQRAQKYLERRLKEWRKLADRNVDDLSDEHIKRQMDGHAIWDDPPKGWTEQDVLLWSRGYLYAESTFLGNALEIVEYYFRLREEETLYLNTEE